MMHAPATWHHGLIAEWWAIFNSGGPEIEYYGDVVRRGQPALDAGCGTGRLLLPWLRDGLDVDGCDVSADMVERCRAAAAADGLEPTLFVQALHALEPPRRYQTVVACGVLGLGSTRAQDEEAVRRLYAALEPGGTLLLDNEVPYSSAARWRRWTTEGRAGLPTAWPDEPVRRTAPDGREFALCSRTLAVDPLDQCVHLAIRAETRLAGRLLAAEERELSMRMWFRDELVLMLRCAGFASVDVRGGFTSRAPVADDETLVFVAQKPGEPLCRCAVGEQPDELGAGRGAELLVDGADVSADGHLGDPEQCGQLPGREALAQALDDRGLPPGQLDAASVAEVEAAGAGIAAELLGDQAYEPAGNRRLAAEHAADHVRQEVGSDRPGEIAGRTGADRRQQLVVVDAAGQHDDERIGCRQRDLGRRADRSPRRVEVDQVDVRSPLLRGDDGAVRVVCLPAVRLRGKREPDCGAGRFVLGGDQHPRADARGDAGRAHVAPLVPSGPRSTMRWPFTVWKEALRRCES
jgi:SAM-dependent methyltransferase